MRSQRRTGWWRRGLRRAGQVDVCLCNVQVRNDLLWRDNNRGRWWGRDDRRPSKRDASTCHCLNDHNAFRFAHVSSSALTVGSYRRLVGFATLTSLIGAMAGGLASAVPLIPVDPTRNVQPCTNRLVDGRFGRPNIVFASPIETLR